MSRIKGRLAFLTIAAMLSTMAFAASAASADIPFEALDPNTGEPCGAVTVEGASVSGGCLIDAVGSYRMVDGDTNCNATFKMRVDSQGDFYTYDAETDYQVNPNCYHSLCRDTASAGKIRVPSPGETVFDWDLCVVHNASGDESHLPVTGAELTLGETTSTLYIPGEAVGCPLPAEYQQNCDEAYPGVETWFEGTFYGEGSLQILEY